MEGERPLAIVMEFIQNPMGPASQHPVIHEILKNVLHKNLVLRLRTGAVREILSVKYGNYFDQGVDECPMRLAHEILTTGERERFVYDIKKNMRDNIREQFGVSLDAKTFGYPLFDAFVANVEAGTELGCKVMKAIEDALTHATCEEIKDANNVAAIHARGSLVSGRGLMGRVGRAGLGYRNEAVWDI